MVSQKVNLFTKAVFAKWAAFNTANCIDLFFNSFDILISQIYILGQEGTLRSKLFFI
jgi:hypothetical protein